MASEIERGEERGERDREREERGERERAESGRDELYLYKRGQIYKKHIVYVLKNSHIYKTNAIYTKRIVYLYMYMYNLLLVCHKP